MNPLSNKNKKTLSFLILAGLLFFPILSAHSQTPPRPITLAAIFSLTGQAADGNQSSVLGTRLAVEEINNSGGLLNRNLSLILLDNRSTPIGSSQAAQQAVSIDAVGIIGAQWSSHSLAIAEVAQKNKIPMISNFSTHPELTMIGEYIFRVCFTDHFQGRVMADFARKELNAATASIFVDLNSDYSLELSHIFRSYFESLGGKIIDEIEYKAKELKIAPMIKQASKNKVDVIFLTGHQESGTIAFQLQEHGIDSVFLGGDGWGDKSFLLLGGKNLKRGYFCTHWSESSDRKETQAFIQKYSQRIDFGTGAALAFDAVMVLAKAIEKAGTTNGQDISRALLEMDQYQGVTGTIRFDTSGNPMKSAVIMEIKNGTPYYLKTLSP